MSFRGMKNYYHHDNRGLAFRGRQIPFKPGFNVPHRNIIPRLRDDRYRNFFGDGDVEMTVEINRTRGRGVRYNPMIVRRSLPNDITCQPRRYPLQGSPSGWYQVILIHCKKYVQQDVMNAILQYLRPIPFVPYNIKSEGEDVTFFIDNHCTAEAVYAANDKIKIAGGWRVRMKVQSCLPSVSMDNALKEKIRFVMSSMFDTNTKHLNLAKFHSNDEFVKNNFLVPLNRPTMLRSIFEIIAESVPNLKSLDLSNNNIFSKEKLVMLKRSAPDLKLLNLSKNKIRNLSVLHDLQGMKVEILVLNENPLCNDFHDKTAYVREVRKIFKSLRQLDGLDLPPPIDFGIEETQSRLPENQKNFLCNPEGEIFTTQFLEQFFVMYDDQTSRDSLLKAYTDHAQFSMNAYTSNSVANISRYISESRNWKKVNSARRTKLLHVGKEEIVRYLNSLPKTQHDLSSFNLDLMVYRPEVISLSVCGIFRETDVTENVIGSNIKAFSRTFVLVQNGPGFNIANDMLSITNATPTQISNAFRSPVISAPSTSTTSNSETEIANSPDSSMTEEELNQKRQMVITLATQTGMNLSWSEKCLAETNWDFNNATHAFTYFNKIGKIPQDAFSN